MRKETATTIANAGVFANAKTSQTMCTNTSVRKNALTLTRTRTRTLNPSTDHTLTARATAISLTRITTLDSSLTLDLSQWEYYVCSQY